MWSLLILINFHLNNTKNFYRWKIFYYKNRKLLKMILWRKKLNEIYLTFFLRKLRMKKMSLNNIKMRTGVLLTMIDFFRITFTIHYFNAKVLASLVIVVRVKDPIEIKTHFSLMQ